MFVLCSLPYFLDGLRYQSLTMRLATALYVQNSNVSLSTHQNGNSSIWWFCEIHRIFYQLFSSEHRSLPKGQINLEFIVEITSCTAVSYGNCFENSLITWEEFGNYFDICCTQNVKITWMEITFLHTVITLHWFTPPGSLRSLVFKIHAIF